MRRLALPLRQRLFSGHSAQISEIVRTPVLVICDRRLAPLPRDVQAASHDHGTGYLLGIRIVFEFAGGDLCSPLSVFLTWFVCREVCPEINLSLLAVLEIRIEQ